MLKHPVDWYITTKDCIKPMQMWSLCYYDPVDKELKIVPSEQHLFKYCKNLPYEMRNLMWDKYNSDFKKHFNENTPMLATTLVDEEFKALVTLPDSSWEELYLNAIDYMYKTFAVKQK